MNDYKLVKFLVDNDVQNIEDVRCIHLFGICWENNTIVHHSVDNFEDFYDYIHEIDYQRIMIIFKNGGSVAWDIDINLLREGLDNLENGKTTIKPLIN